MIYYIKHIGYCGKDNDSEYLMHHGIRGQKWGVKNGPPYPLGSDDKSAAEKKLKNTGIINNIKEWYANQEKKEMEKIYGDHASLKNPSRNKTYYSGKRENPYRTEYRKKLMKSSEAEVLRNKIVATDIMNQTLDDSKPPTGNQNCQLCTFSMESSFRYHTEWDEVHDIQRRVSDFVLPRPVYSPSDPLFYMKNSKIVTGLKDKDIRKFSSIQDIKNIINSEKSPILPVKPRFYCHVKWGRGSGGHEFMINEMTNGIHVIDAQQGIVASIDSDEGKEYFKNINWNQSYMYRVDNKRLNYEYVKVNGLKYIPDWDEEKDKKLL